MASTFTTSDGVRLNYTDGGTGAPVLLVAGHTAPLVSWQPVSDALLDAGYRVVAMDRRHTGDSDFPDAGMRMARQGADIHEVIGALGLEDVAVVGSSLGASATLAMVDVFGTERLRALVLVDQTPKMINEGDWSLGMYDLTRDTLEEFLTGFGSPEQMSGSRFRRPNSVTAAPELVPLLMEFMAKPYPHERLRPLLRDHAVQDWRDVLTRIDVPTLAVGGRHSELWPVEHAEFIAGAVPNGELVVLENSGHAPMWSEPAAFNAAVLPFLAR